VSTAHGGDVALTLAKMMARKTHGSIFMVDAETLTWTQPSEPVVVSPAVRRDTTP